MRRDGDSDDKRRGAIPWIPGFGHVGDRTGGVYTSPNMTSGIRERIWEVLSEWYYQLGQGSIVMTWRDPGAVSEQEIRTLGESPKEIVDADGVYLVKYH